LKDLNISINIERKCFNDGKRHAWNSGIKIGNYCRKKKLWIPKNCLQCGETFYSYPSKKQQFCSLSCRSLYWLTPERDPRKYIRRTKKNTHQKYYGSSRWNNWRKSVFERDNYTCQLCLNSRKYLNAHHLHGVTFFPEFVYDTDNGVTVCAECHHLIHRDKQLKDNGWYYKE